MTLLQVDTNQAPHHYFPSLGSVLGQPAFSNIKLKEFGWLKHPNTDLAQVVISHRLSLAEQNDPYLQETLMQEYFQELQTQEGAPKLQAALTLIGRIQTEG